MILHAGREPVALTGQGFADAMSISGGDTDGHSGAPSGPTEPMTAGHLFFLLHHLVRQRETALGRELAEAGLTLGQWQVLATLRRLDRATMGEVAAFCATDRTTLTRTVDRLARDGLIRRERALQDRRQVHLSLTPEGCAVFQIALVEVNRFNERVTGALDVGDVERMQPMIRRILVHVLDDPDWVEDLMAFRRLKDPRPRA